MKNTVSLLPIATLVYLVFEYITPLLRAICRKLLICFYISNLKEAIASVYKNSIPQVVTREGSLL